ncbi:MAG: NAD(P)-binding protein [Lamprobacter sp.]|uniref:potassium channel family protein n=1 Tax=Lamprobacter sp. TaxID=3100796 RepID=UPI002B25FEE1|nr:NAD(P)-binding protein [Lamprobacter sp.]MEA3640471.1 NAD(P)-binding protein [Lamprobacter sp.]
MASTRAGQPVDSIIFLILRRMRAPLLTLIIIYSITIIGLVLIPGRNPDGSVWHLSIFHAFYFVSYMSTTIGFGELPQEFSDAQRIWVTLCIYATVSGWLYSVGSMIGLLQDKALRRTMEERRFARYVGHIKEDFYLVCGYGQTGSGLVRALTERNQRAVVLDNNPDRIDLLKLESLHEFVPALRADVRRPDSLLLAGLRSPYCAGVLALTSSNEVNLKVALAAKLMHPDTKVICRADSHDVEANMASFGTDHIYDPFDIFARYLSTAIDSPCLTALHDWLGQLNSSILPEPIYPPADGLWIICGYGRFGKALTSQLAAQGVELIVVEMAPERTGLPPGLLIKGRGTEAVTLEQADIHRAVGIVAGTDNDANNLSIIMTAKELNPNLFTVVRENQLMNEELFKAVKADILMHPSLIVAQRIRTLLSAPLLSEFVSQAEKERDSWCCELVSRIVALVEVRPPILWELRFGETLGQVVKALNSQGQEPTLGDLLRDPRSRDEPLQAIILLHKRGGHHAALPDLGQRLEIGDQLLLCGRPGARDWMQWTLNNPDVLSYVVTGVSQPRGSVWRWLEQSLNHRNEVA